MTYRPFTVAAAVALAVTVATSAALAQAPKGADTLSRAAVAESLKVLDKLNADVKAHPKDARLWYHRAMVAFALSLRADQKDTIPELDYRKLRLIAGDSFLEAVNLDPKNGRYLLSKSDFATADRLLIGRAAGRPVTCDINLDHFTDPDIAMRQAQLIHNGWVCWVDFDGYENRAQANFRESFDPSRGLPKIPDIRRGTLGTVDAPGSNAPTSVMQAAIWGGVGFDSCPGVSMPLTAIMQAATGVVNEHLHALPFDVAGERDYLAAKRVFEAAYALDPKGPQAYSSFAMVLAARDNWDDLQRTARNQTLVTPDDPWTWMTVALATYRLHPGKESRDMFESAFARLDERERNRLDRLDRVLRPRDSVRYQHMDAATRQEAANTSWTLADPLWSAPGADPRTEFLARVTYAELRWSVQGLHGADTDRGQVYIRYGPPNRVVGFQPNQADSVPVGAMHTFWIYEGNLIFAFDKHLHTGSTTVNGCDRQLNERIASEVPARWDNIAMARIDSMPTQAARFRAAGDSVDFFLATKAPVDTIRAYGVANTQTWAHVWLVPFGSDQSFVDSVKLGARGDLQWIRRVSPGPYYYRVEATAPGILVAGRTAAQMMMGPDSATGFRLIGFGLSDLLIASRVNASGPTRRWRDLDITPLLGDIAKGSEIVLVWENYELGRRGANAQYDVTVTIDRELTTSGQIGARIANMLGVGVNSSKNKVTMKFERTVPFAPVLTENVTLALRDTPPGSYRLTVQVTDKVSGRTSSRTVRVVIHE